MAAPPLVAGSWFHSLQATSHALQPMQTVVSVKKAHPLGHHAFSTSHTKALPSWIETLGSPTSDVSSLTTSPVETPS